MDQKTLRRMLVAAALIVVVAAGGWFAWRQYNAHQEASQTKELTQRVKQAMQDEFDTDSTYSAFNIHVADLSLIRESDHKYIGIATLRTPRTGDHDIMIEVTADGSNVMWEAEHGAMLFLLQESIPEPSPSPTPGGWGS